MPSPTTDDLIFPYLKLLVGAWPHVVTQAQAFAELETAFDLDELKRGKYVDHVKARLNPREKGLLICQGKNDRGDEGYRVTDAGREYFAEKTRQGKTRITVKELQEDIRRMFPDAYEPQRAGSASGATSRPLAAPEPQPGGDEETEASDERLDGYVDLLAAEKQVILAGPPGTGKTWLAQQLQQRYREQGGEVWVVTFHPSMAYEDFVEGLRPALGADSGGGLRYELVPGHFRRAVTHALAHPEADHLLVIDEINRGNLGRILGELITVLEGSKRLRRSAPDTTQEVADLAALLPDATARTKWHASDDQLFVSLAYSKVKLAVPENLHLLGTMNTTDRSIAWMDYALRRRFAFEHIAPDYQVVRDLVVEKGISKPWLPAIELFEELNARIERWRGPDFLLGHAFLLSTIEGTNGSDQAEEVARAVGQCLKRQIVPLLQEYFHGEPQILRQLLGPKLMRKAAAASEDEEEFHRLEVGRLEASEVYLFLCGHLVPTPSLAAD